MAKCKMAKPGAKQVNYILKSNKKIWKLDLDDNKFQDDGIKEIANGL